MRKPIAMLALLIYLAAYIAIAATIGTWINGTPRILQLIFFVAAGVVWIFPLKPLFAWMNTPEA
ncbi:MAG: DUF2842 domain-containing protein [Pseudomonadota bacterium]